MTNAVAIRPVSTAIAVTEDGKMLSLIRRTVAADTNNDEFDLFVNMARQLRLDPLRRQIYCFIFSKNDAEKRRMTMITSIDGFRTIADRTGNYRPDEDEPTYEIDPTLVDPLKNPAGLVKATVRVWKFSHGQWHKVTASAYWTEYAPLKQDCAAGYDWVDTGETWKDSGKPKKKKTALGPITEVLDTSGNWGKMPRLMLAKVAEALALRKAWPDDFSNLYGEEEVERTRAADLTASEIVEQTAALERQAKIGGPSIYIDWCNGAPIEAVRVGGFADRAMAFIEENKEEPSVVLRWAEQNRAPLREFWSAAPSDALAVKKRIEALAA